MGWLAREKLRSHLGRLLVASFLACGFAAAATPPPPGISKSSPAPKSATTLITDYYQSILGRAPDAGGLAYWEGQAALVQSLGANANETARVLALTFFNSPEYRALNRTNDQYLRDLYATFFKRAPDSGGLAYWAGQIQSGQTREGVLLWFLFSTEFDGYMKGLFGDAVARAETDMVVDFYRGALSRLPDEGGFRYWVGRLRAAQCIGASQVVAEVEAISLAFFSSPDYAARRRIDHEFLTDLYNAFMRRGADLGGFIDWGQKLRTGLYTRDALRRAFLASPEFQARVQAVMAQGCSTLASGSNLTASVVDQSVSPFLATLEMRGSNLDAISAVSFLVTPRALSVSKAVQATYTNTYLASAGYSVNTGGGYRLPVFGLYAAHANTVMVNARFTDGSVRSLNVDVATGPFVDPTGLYAAPVLLKKRAPGVALGFDFFYLKSLETGPVVVDTDGEVRWWVPGDIAALSSIFEGNGFWIGEGLRWVRLELDGRLRETTIATSTDLVHHNIDPGRTGFLVEVDDRVNDVVDLEHILLEVARDGTVIKEWRLGDLISAYMAANGDDPSTFVRFGRDWFHMNAVAYDPRDDSLVVSSRENFVIKIRYLTGEIVWILGDPTKYWYTFKSLRDKSLALDAPGLFPIGQHAVSITPRGTVMVFNNGTASLQPPPGAPAGASRTFSAVSEYEIDPIAGTAREVASFDYDKTILSRFCSSAYAAGDTMLVSYAQASNGTRARLVGVDAARRVVFDFEYVNGGCNTSWNALPVPFENLVFP